MTLPVFVEPGTRGALSTWRLPGASSVLEIAPHGAHVIAWEPRPGRPVLFLSPRSQFVSGKAIRGGVPLVFPWFGPRRDDPGAAQHGFARVREWRPEAVERREDGAVTCAFVLSDDADTLARWPHRFRARLRVRAERDLDIALEVHNTDASPFTFEAALHTYFAVSDVRQIVVTGLEQVAFFERAGGVGAQPPSGAPIRFAGEVDRTYSGTTAACALVDPGWKRRITIAKSGSRTTVVWNPGAAKAAAMADLGGEACRDFACIETASAGVDAVTLLPGAAHVLSATIAVEAFTEA